jgi:energy-converting hydrogenase Eha subunit A
LGSQVPVPRPPAQSSASAHVKNDGAQPAKAAAKTVAALHSTPRATTRADVAANRACITSQDSPDRRSVDAVSSVRMRDLRLAAWVLAASFGYAVVRYHVFGSVSAEQLPIFVANKAISVASLVLLGLSRLVDEKPRRKWLGFVGLAGALIHLMMSLLVLAPAYLPKHFKPDGMMQWNVEASILAGVLSLVALLWLGFAAGTHPIERQRPTTSLVLRLGRIALGLTAVHALLLGYSTWAAVDQWPGSLPPITMISFGIAAAMCVLPRRRRTTSQGHVA